MHDKLRPITDVLDTLHCGAALIDRQGTIVYINDRLCRVVGRTCNQVIGRPVLDFVHTEKDRDQTRYSLEHFDEAQDRESRLTHADGRGIPIVLSARQLPGEKPVSEHRVVTMIEISKQKAAEERYLEQYREVAKLSDTVLEQAIKLKRHAESLEIKVRERTAELHEANMDSIYMLAVASEVRDEDTGAHVRRIEHYAREVAAALGRRKSEAENIGHAAILHDVGKIQVPDEILKKPGKLTPDERATMQAHTVAGERILSDKPFFRVARRIARSHHENWDGSGYPDGLRGEHIPLPARIVHLVDVFDALTSTRVYKPPWPVDRALDEITTAAGRMFDPKIVEAFRKLQNEHRFDPIVESLRT